MPVNKFLDHILVLPEDDANAAIANGFVEHVDKIRQIQILPAAGGWCAVCEAFAANHIAAMRKYPKRLMVLLIDFDDQKNRFEQVVRHIPPDLHERVFVLGSLINPEVLKRALSMRGEDVGRALANECRLRDDGLSGPTWGHQMLAHNLAELQRIPNEFFNTLYG